MVRSNTREYPVIDAPLHLNGAERKSPGKGRVRSVRWLLTLAVLPLAACSSLWDSSFEVSSPVDNSQLTTTATQLDQQAASIRSSSTMAVRSSTTTAPVETTTTTGETTTTTVSTTTTLATTTTTIATTTTTTATTAPTTAATLPPTTAPAQNTGCDPNYSGCVPIASDVDCAGGSGNGPAYAQGPVQVIGTDIYGLDGDNDGIGCE